MKSILIRYFVVFGLGLIVMLCAQIIRDRFAFCHQDYDLLSPARRCGHTLPQGEWNYEDLREQLSMKKLELKSSGKVTHLSIYFQDLDHGPRFGIGEYDKFHPGSLMKLPLAIFFLHAVDQEPHILDQTLSYTGSLAISDNVESPDETIQPNTPYTVRELLAKMIMYSDNRSYLVLFNEMNRLNKSMAYLTFRDLDILQMMLQSEDIYLSISSYAKLFSVLYNIGYLSKDMSQFALQLLSDTTFQGGIVAGVPSDLRVAHKFGHAFVDGEDQLHDCGIVYHPKMAYIVCIMTSGPDTNALNEAIIGVSRLVYENVSALNVDN